MADERNPFEDSEIAERAARGAKRDATPRNFVLSEDQFERLLARQGAPPADRPAPSPDAQVGALLEQVRGTDRELHTIERVRCISLETRSTFEAVIAKSKAFPAGRVVSLESYAYPAGIDTHVAEGGLVPDGKRIKNPDGSPTKEYRQWRWSEFWRRDLQRYVGQDGAWLRRMADVQADAAE